MAKGLTETKIASRADRARLKAQDKPYWRGIDPEVHLGYRKGQRGGVWVVRWRKQDGRYSQVKIGTADDELREGTLDFEQAVRAARATVEAERRLEKVAADGPALTVRAAVESYIADRDARDSARRGREVRSDARSRLELYVIGRQARGKRADVATNVIAEIGLHNLEESDLLTWRATLPGELKRTTKQRLMNDLKAALNEAYTANRKRLPATLPGAIAHGLRDLGHEGDEAESVARENQILSDMQVANLIGAAREIDAERGWEGDLYRMVVVLAATGARFSQVIRMRVSDVQTEQRRLMMPTSRKGNGAKVAAVPVAVPQDVLNALAPIVNGRASSERLLERWRSKQVPGGIRWERTDRGPWETASEMDRAWDAIRTRAGLPEAIPYALRHSSIVRGIRANLPIRLVASSHDTSVSMIERHYGHFIADGLDDMAAAAVVSLIPVAA